MRTYIKEKVKVYKESGIRFSKEQIEHMHSLKNEIQIDNYAYNFLFPRVETSREPQVWCGNI